MKRTIPFEALRKALSEAGLLLASASRKEPFQISNVAYDSRKVEEGGLFICKGAQFKPEYIQQAAEQGAIAVMSEVAHAEAKSLAQLLVTDIREAMVVVANLYYREPWKHLTVIGVTGTKGKSTTVQMLKRIFDEDAERRQAPLTGVTSSTMIYDGMQTLTPTLTTPETLDLYQHLANAVEAGVERMIIEVSSQALKYGRVAGIIFDHGIFLNIAPDHISPVEHPDFADYFQAKLQLFEVAKNAHIPMHMDHDREILAAARQTDKVYSFSSQPPADLWAESITVDESGLHFTMRTVKRHIPVHLAMHGRFNIFNALAATSVALACKVPEETITLALAQVQMAGHMQIIQGEDLTVVVDFAHNEISFREVIKSAQNDWPTAPLWIVFGAPGGKGINRREGMGYEASRVAAQIILTEDDPAQEQITAINQDIQAGYMREVSSLEILDRQEAIRYAIAQAPAGAVVLILGKGNEHEMKRAHGGDPWLGDATVAQEALAVRS